MIFIDQNHILGPFDSGGGGGGGNSNLFYTGVCHFGLKYSTYKSGGTSKKRYL